jgi:HEAT repeat protein
MGVVKYYGWLALALGLTSCGPPDPGASTPAPLTGEFLPGLAIATLVQQSAVDGLPILSESRIAEVADLLDATLSSGRLAHSAKQRLEEISVAERASAFLSMVENRETSVELRQLGYAWLRDQAPAEILPRLCLRLKYEKDGWSAIAIAHALLLRGNGAGLDALVTILEGTPETAAAEQIRAYAAELIGLLPIEDDWLPGQGFESDWQRLLAARLSWNHKRQLADQEEPPAQLSLALRAELWRMIARFQSQPLRPVDDARFVLTRQRGAVVPMLLQAAHDPDRYVREHALQTLAWIGNAVGHWSLAHDFDYLEELLPVLADPLSRTRGLEALGAAGLPTAAASLWPWLKNGNLEERSAAADAMLRCAGQEQAAALQKFLLQPSVILGPEARYSLQVLLADLAQLPANELANSVAEPAETEKQRRDRWRQQRAWRASLSD